MPIDVESLYNRRNDSPFNRTLVGDLLENLGHNRPDDTALVGGPGAYSLPDHQVLNYGTYNSKANQFAQRLDQLALERASRILFICENSTEALIAKFGTAKAGMVSVPANPNFSEDVMAHVIDLTQPSVLVIDAEFIPKFDSLLAGHSFQVKLAIPIGGQVAASYQDFNAYLADQPSQQPDRYPLHGDDIWEILFTSGTTSWPKGVMISHHYSYHAASIYGMHMSRGVDQIHHYRVASFLPLIYHCADLTLAISAMLYGGTLIFGRRQNAQEMAQVLAQSQATALWTGRIDIMEAVFAAADREDLDLTSLNCLLYAYSHLEPELYQKIQAHCSPRVQVINSFSQTEVLAGFRLYHAGNEALLADHPGENVIGTADARLQQKLVSPDQTMTGEVAYRSPAAFSGYYRNPKDTEEAIQDDWFRSGDLLKLEAADRAIMVDRKKDVIKTGGENVSSARVETILLRHPEIKQAAVLGMPDSHWGEAVTAVVASDTLSPADEKRLISFCHDQLAGFECPKRIYFKPHLDESIGGKVKKASLKSWIRSRENEE